VICEEALLAEIGRASFVIPANGRTTMDVGAGFQPARLVANQVRSICHCWCPATFWGPVRWSEP